MSKCPSLRDQWSGPLQKNSHHLFPLYEDTDACRKEIACPSSHKWHMKKTIIWIQNFYLPVLCPFPSLYQQVEYLLEPYFNTNLEFKTWEYKYKHHDGPPLMKKNHQFTNYPPSWGSCNENVLFNIKSSKTKDPIGTQCGELAVLSSAYHWLQQSSQTETLLTKGVWRRHSWSSPPQSHDSRMSILSENYTIPLDKKNVMEPPNSISSINHFLHKCQRKIVASDITKIVRDLEKSPV